MPRKPRKRAPRKVKQKLVTKAPAIEYKENKELNEYVQEASEVRQLTSMAGWAILERDIKVYRETIINKLAYLHPDRPEFYEARLLFQASDKLLSLVNDYEANRDKMIEFLNKLENPALAVALDVDTE